MPIAIFFLIIAIAFFFWAIRNDQFDDMESPALKIVIDDHQQNNKDSTNLSTDKSDNISSDNSIDRLKDDSKK